MADEAPLSKQDVINQVAQTLIERRKLRKLSVSDISQTLKIRSFYIEAIEKGEWEKLPGDVYIRGFIVRYAQYMGLNGVQLLEPYFAKTGTASLPSAVGDTVPPVGNAEVSKSSWIWAGLGILLFIALIKFLKPQNEHKPVPAAAPSPVIEMEKTMPSATDTAKVNADKHRLDVFSPLPLWLRVTAGDRTFEGFIPQESTWTMNGDAPFTVRMGHTKDVAMSFDSHPVRLGENQRKVVLPSEN
jgi:hypothetical protein